MSAKITPSYSYVLVCPAFSGHLICGISGCYLVGEIVVVGFLWGAVAEGRVEPFGIVAEFDVAYHILSCLVSGGIYGAIDPFNFQSGIKRFRERVIVTDTGSADGASNTVAGSGQILRTCIGCRDRNEKWRSRRADSFLRPYPVRR
jgi:hypothetical protein